MVRRIITQNRPLSANDNGVFRNRRPSSQRVIDTGLITVRNGKVFARAVPAQTPPLTLLGRYVSTVNTEGSANPDKTALNELLRLRREKGDKRLSMVAMPVPSESTPPSIYVIYAEQ